jgi:hypothetical protein
MTQENLKCKSNIDYIDSKIKNSLCLLSVFLQKKKNLEMILVIFDSKLEFNNWFGYTDTGIGNSARLLIKTCCEKKKY